MKTRQFVMPVIAILEDTPQTNLDALLLSMDRQSGIRLAHERDISGSALSRNSQLASIYKSYDNNQ